MKNTKRHRRLSFSKKCVFLVLLCGILAFSALGVNAMWHGKPEVSKRTNISSGGNPSNLSQIDGQSRVSSQPAPSSSEQDDSSGKTPGSQQNDLSNSAMIGNSYVEDLNIIGILPQMDFYDRVGLNVETVFSLSTSTGKDPIIDMLNARQYKSVYLLFGENELGWEGTKPFISAYGKVIDAVRSRQPNARIYVQSIFPVSASVSAQNTDNTNNARISEYNTQLKALAVQEGAVYLDVASAMTDNAGNLPSDAAPDGIHPNDKYCKLWADYLKAHG